MKAFKEYFTTQEQNVEVNQQLKAELAEMLFAEEEPVTWWKQLFARPLYAGLAAGAMGVVALGMFNNPEAVNTDTLTLAKTAQEVIAAEVTVEDGSKTLILPAQTSAFQSTGVTLTSIGGATPAPPAQEQLCSMFECPIK